jgi:beta-lactam-binding protein with PASTA domain
MAKVKFMDFKRNVIISSTFTGDERFQAVGVNKTNMTVPNLIGLNSAAAVAAITGAGFFVGSNTVGGGVVATQSLASGVKAVVHAQINIA